MVEGFDVVDLENVDPGVWFTRVPTPYVASEGGSDTPLTWLMSGAQPIGAVGFR